MKRRGFALWEVVAVLAVLVVAAIILFPLFARSRQGHNPPGCSSYLKHIGLGFRQYTQDHDDKYPLVVVNDASSKNLAFGWADAIQPYIKSTQMLQCPVDTDVHPPSFEPSENGYTDYWFNRNLAGLETKAVNNVRMTILSGDGNDGIDITNARYSLSAIPVEWRNNKNSPAYRHRDGANYAFTDGHFKWYKPISIPDIAKDAGAPTFAVK